MEKQQEKIIGIVGGVGPEAGTLLHRFVIAETAIKKNIKKDQDHLTTLHLSLNSIPDRTKFLLGEQDINPANDAFEALKIITNAAKTLGKKAVIGVPCNTFHANPIFCEFKKQAEKYDKSVVILNMIEETKRYIQEFFGDVTKIGLLSTTGTREQRIYHNILEPLGFEIQEVDSIRQRELHETIYHAEWGIKTVSPISEKATKRFQQYAREIKEKGAEAMILGCTEIPLALSGKFFEGIPLIDPMKALAMALVKNSISETIKIS